MKRRQASDPGSEQHLSKIGKPEIDDRTEAAHEGCCKGRLFRLAQWAFEISLGIPDQSGVMTADAPFTCCIVDG